VRWRRRLRQLDIVILTFERIEQQPQ